MECCFCIFHAYCEHVWVFFNSLAMNVVNSTASIKHILYFIFMQDWKDNRWVLKLVHKVLPICHWFQFKAQVFYVLSVIEFLIFPKRVVVSIFFVQVHHFLLKECYQSIYLFCHALPVIQWSLGFWISLWFGKEASTN